MNMWFWEFSLPQELISWIHQLHYSPVRRTVYCNPCLLEDQRGDVAGQTVLEKERVLTEDQQGARISLAG